MACVELKKINKTFGNIEIIPSVDLRVEDGEFVVFVGPSGCGKSTHCPFLLQYPDGTCYSGDHLYTDAARQRTRLPDQL